MPEKFTAVIASSIPALGPTLMNETNTVVIARLDRATQYSRDSRVQPRSRGVLDRPVKPGDDRIGWLAMALSSL